jgi:hypothetical protein
MVWVVSRRLQTAQALKSPVLCTHELELCDIVQICSCSVIKPPIFSAKQPRNWSSVSYLLINGNYLHHDALVDD